MKNLLLLTLLFAFSNTAISDDETVYQPSGTEVAQVAEDTTTTGVEIEEEESVEEPAETESDFEEVE